MKRIRKYDFLLYNSLSYEDRLKFNLDNMKEAYKIQRPEVSQEELEIKLKEYQEFAMKNYEEAQNKKRKLKKRSKKLRRKRVINVE